MSQLNFSAEIRNFISAEEGRPKHAFIITLRGLGCARDSTVLYEYIDNLSLPLSHPRYVHIYIESERTLNNAKLYAIDHAKERERELEVGGMGRKPAAAANAVADIISWVRNHH